MQAMTEREALYTLSGKVQVDDAYLGGERTGGKVGRGSENKVAFVAAVSLTDEGYPLAGQTQPGVRLQAQSHRRVGQKRPGRWQHRLF